MASDWTDPRPLSPHLQVWRFHATMLVSILHRVCGVGLYLGAILIVVWLGAIAGGPRAYAVFEGFALSFIGRFLMFGFTLALMFHLANGIRHFFWDMGKGFLPSTATATAWLVFAFAFAATLGLWAAAYIL